MRKQRPHIRHGERASSIVEAMLCMFLILLLTFGLLQFFYYSVAQMVTDYAAFRAARSVAVGFKEVIAEREAKLKAIAASGRMRFPIDLAPNPDKDGQYMDSSIIAILGADDGLRKEKAPFSTPAGQFEYERLAIIDYMEQRRDLKYEYWEEKYNILTIEKGASGTSFSVKTHEVGNALSSTASFHNYPWAIVQKIRKAFLSNNQLDISAEAELANHAAAFTE